MDKEDEWVKKIYIHSGILLSHRKDEIMPFVVIQIN